MTANKGTDHSSKPKALAFPYNSQDCREAVAPWLMLRVHGMKEYSKWLDDFQNWEACSQRRVK
jgi:hypothetical protein